MSHRRSELVLRPNERRGSIRKKIGTHGSHQYLLFVVWYYTYEMHQVLWLFLSFLSLRSFILLFTRGKKATSLNMIKWVRLAPLATLPEWVNSDDESEFSSYAAAAVKSQVVAEGCTFKTNQTTVQPVLRWTAALLLLSVDAQVLSIPWILLYTILILF